MQDVLMDVLRALTSPNMDIRKKTLDIALDLITSRNIDEVVMVLKKEVMKTQNKELDKGPEYRQLLVQAIHSCAVKFPDVAGSVIHLLMDFLGDTNTASALDVVFFVREIMETNSKLRASILERLLDSYNQIRSSRVCSCTLWIIGEYCDQKDDIYAALEVLFLKLTCMCMPTCCLGSGRPVLKIGAAVFYVVREHAEQHLLPNRSCSCDSYHSLITTCCCMFVLLCQCICPNACMLSCIAFLLALLMQYTPVDIHCEAKPHEVI